MDKENKYYNVIADLVKQHKRYHEYEAILDDIIDDVYSHSVIIIDSVANEDVITAYLQKVVNTSIITVPKKLGIRKYVRPVTIKENAQENPVQSFAEVKQAEPVIEEIAVPDEPTELYKEPAQGITVNKELVDKMINSAEKESVNFEEQSELELEIPQDLVEGDLESDNTFAEVSEKDFAEELESDNTLGEVSEKDFTEELESDNTLGEVSEKDFTEELEGDNTLGEVSEKDIAEELEGDNTLGEVSEKDFTEELESDNTLGEVSEKDLAEDLEEPAVTEGIITPSDDTGITDLREENSNEGLVDVVLAPDFEQGTDFNIGEESDNSLLSEEGNFENVLNQDSAPEESYPVFELTDTGSSGEESESFDFVNGNDALLEIDENPQQEDSIIAFNTNSEENLLEIVEDSSGNFQEETKVDFGDTQLLSSDDAEQDNNIVFGNTEDIAEETIAEDSIHIDNIMPDGLEDFQPLDNFGGSDDLMPAINNDFSLDSPLDNISVNDSDDFLTEKQDDIKPKNTSFKKTDFSVFGSIDGEQQEDFDKNEAAQNILNIDSKYQSLNILKVFDLRFKQQYSVEKIAEELNMPAKDVYTSLAKIADVV